MMSVIGLMTLTLLAIAAIATVMASNLFISSMWVRDLQLAHGVELFHSRCR